jgi:hypothetical protein
MGIYKWVTSLTGSWGPGLLAAYEANALWINSVVLLYGLVLLLSWQNTERVVDSLVCQIVEQASKIHGGGEHSRRRVRLSSFRLSWEKALSQSRFPLIARQADFLPRRSTLENTRRAISDDYLIRRSASRLRRLWLELEK